MSIDALIAACHARSCAPPPVGTGGSSSSGGGGSTAAMRNPLGASRAAAGASGVEHLIKQSAGHPAQRYIQKAHEAFRDARRTGIGQDNSSAVDHANGMKALRQAHAVAKASSPKGTLHSAIKTALIKKKESTMTQHSVAASAFTKEEFMAAAEEFYNKNHSPKDGRFSSGGGGGGPTGGGPASIKHRLSAKRIRQGARRADYLNTKVGTPASKKRASYPVGGDGQPRHGIAQTIADNKARRASMGLKPAPHGLDRSGRARPGRLVEATPAQAKAAKRPLNAAPRAKAAAPKKSGNYTTKVIPGHTQNPKKSGNYTTKPLPKTGNAAARRAGYRKQLDDMAKTNPRAAGMVKARDAAEAKTGIAANIAKNNVKNPKKSGGYITKANAASIAAAEKRAAARKTDKDGFTKVAEYPSKSGKFNKAFESAFAKAKARKA